MNQSELELYFSTADAGWLLGWINFIVDNLLHFSFANKNHTRRHVKHELTSFDILMSYLRLLLERFEAKTDAALPNMSHSISSFGLPYHPTVS